MDNENTLTDVQEEVGALQETAEEVSETGNEETAEASEVATPEMPQAVAKPVQTAEQDHEFKMRRLQSEQKAAELEAKLSKVTSTLQEKYGLPKDMGADEIADVLLAHAERKTVEQVKAEREAREAEVRERVKTDPEYMSIKAQLEEYERADAERQFAADLSEIKAKYPDEKATSVLKLGPEFLQLCASGFVTPLVAYEALRNNKKTTAPPSTGDITSSSSKEKDFYTSEEVDKLTDEDYDKNPKLMDIVRKSMLKWGN